MGRNPEANVNVNEASKRSNFNVKDGNCGKLKRSGNAQARIRRAQRIADELTRKFGVRSKSCYLYFCKCAHKLPESTIWEIYESSRGSRIGNSLAYFLAATKAQPQMQ